MKPAGNIQIHFTAILSVDSLGPRQDDGSEAHGKPCSAAAGQSILTWKLSEAMSGNGKNHGKSKRYNGKACSMGINGHQWASSMSFIASSISVLLTSCKAMREIL